MTLQLALSEPVASTIDNFFRIAEDNGWPNGETRIAFGCGCVDAATTKRPFEPGVSSLIGQLRTTEVLVSQRKYNVWGLGTDLYCKVSERCGFAGEFFTGQGLGTYNGGVLQGINLVDQRVIRASGGWLEGFVYWTPCLHSHIGYGIDDPSDRDVQTSGRTKTETYFANAIWNINQTFLAAFEFIWRETAYQGLLDNQGAGFHTQFQWAF